MFRYASEQLFIVDVQLTDLGVPTANLLLFFCQQILQLLRMWLDLHGLPLDLQKLLIDPFKLVILLVLISTLLFQRSLQQFDLPFVDLPLMLVDFKLLLSFYSLGFDEGKLLVYLDNSVFQDIELFTLGIVFLLQRLDSVQWYLELFDEFIEFGLFFAEGLFDWQEFCIDPGMGLCLRVFLYFFLLKLWMTDR